MAGRVPAALQLGTVARTAGPDVVEGALLCPDPACRREHPIVDGIPVVVADLRLWATHQLDAVLWRRDLSPFMESLLGDAAGPGTFFDRERSNLSGGGRSHWGDLDPDSPIERAGSLSEVAAAAIGMLEGPPTGVWLDAGCAVGRASVELARAGADLVVGVDLSFALARTAEFVRSQGKVSYPQRRVGLVYDRREFAVADIPAGRLSFWCADAAALPFADGVFDGALSLNLLDCIASPVGHLLELGRTLAPGRPALLGTPYDWSPSATPIEGWLGGHSQRGAGHGSSALELRRVLGDGAPAGVDTRLVVRDERDRVPWRVEVNERATMQYAVDLLRLERSPADGFSGGPPAGP